MKISKPVLSIFITAILFCSCKQKTENTMTVSGTIDGLKKGTLYFQKTKDSILITIDSLRIKGDGNFSFSHEIESPELFYLYLDKADKNDINDRITFFGEPGEISIKTAWNTFDRNSEITGSVSHEKYIEFQSMLSKFNYKDFELLQKALPGKDTLSQRKLDSIENLRAKNLLRRYQYVINFGLTNPTSYVTPYVTLVEAKDANPKYLDSIVNSLSTDVANSKYGKELEAFLERSK